MTSEQRTLAEIGEKSETYSLPYSLKRQGVEKPDSWTVCRLGDLLELEYGKSLPENEREQGPYPVYGSNGRSGWHSGYHVTGPGIIVGRKGVNLGIEWSHQNYNVIDTAYFINSDSLIGDDLDLKYLYYNLLDFDLDRLKSGSAVPGLNRKDFYDETIAVPPLREQRTIAVILENIDRKILTNNRIGRILENVAQTIFNYRFIEFEEYDEFQETEMGKIPEEFEIGTLSDIVEINHNRIDPSKNPRKHYKLYSFSAYDELQLPEEELGSDINSQKYYVSDHTVLVSKLNPRISRVWRINSTTGDSISSTEFVNLSPIEERYFNFIYSVTKSADFQSYLESHTTGTSGSHQRVKQKDILNYRLPLPPMSTLEKFDSIISPIYNCIGQNSREGRHLRELLDILIPKLMSGELRVEDINIEQVSQGV